MVSVPQNEHPRQIVRSQIVDALKAAFADYNIPVHDTFVRDIKKGVTHFIVVYSPSEYLSRPAGSGEHRTSRPLNRSMNFVILVIANREGDGYEAGQDADMMSRLVELTLNNSFEEALNPQQTSTDFDSEAEVTSCMIEMSYSLDYRDDMNA